MCSEISSSSLLFRILIDDYVATIFFLLLFQISEVSVIAFLELSDSRRLSRSLRMTPFMNFSLPRCSYFLFSIFSLNYFCAESYLLMTYSEFEIASWVSLRISWIYCNCILSFVSSRSDSFKRRSMALWEPASVLS